MEIWDDQKCRWVDPVAEAEKRGRLAGEKWRLFFWGSGFVAGLFCGLSMARAEDITGRIRVIDGDTLWHYPCESGDGCKPEKIRLIDIDAPESYRSTCEAELIAGLRAKARLKEILLARPVRIERCDGIRCTDRHGRTLARIYTPEGEAGAILLAEGLALSYQPGRKAERTAKWCGR